MRKKKFLFAALFLAALVFGFSACENPNGDLLNNGDDSSITDNDSTTNNPNKEIIVIMAMNLNVLSLTYHLRW